MIFVYLFGFCITYIFARIGDSDYSWMSERYNMHQAFWAAVWWPLTWLMVFAEWLRERF